MRKNSLLELGVITATSLLLACASSASQENPVLNQERERVEFDPLDTIDLFHDIRAHDEWFSASRTAVWNALIEANEGLGLQRVKVNAETGLLVSYVRISRTFAGKSASRFVDCGSSITGPRADTYQLDVTVGQGVDSTASDRTRVRMMINASAVQGGASGGAVRCTSTGELEKSITTLVRTRLN